MPKVRSQRSISRAHTTSVKAVNRMFAAQDNAVQHVDVGALKDVSADEILHSVNADDDTSPQHVPNKKERRILKHELFIERLEASRAPYSKSHARRLKRKEKEELTTGGLGSLKAALPSIAPTRTRTTAATIIGVGDSSAGELDAAATTNTTTATTTAATIVDAFVKPINNKLNSKSKQTTDRLEMMPPRPTTTTTATAPPGQIGEGYGTPLMKSQRRRRALTAERFRQPLIRSNPDFTANPFETIRTHARNTLVPHRPPTS